MSKSGKTISVTIPLPLVKELQAKADKVGISRSRYISNLLLRWQTDQSILKSTVSITEPNDCPHRQTDKNGYCPYTQMPCSAPQNEAETCTHYPNKKPDQEL